MSVTSTASGTASDSRVASSSPPKPAPRITTRSIAGDPRTASRIGRAAAASLGAGRRAQLGLQTGDDGHNRKMTSFGYTLSSEETAPRDLVAHARRAEEAGFDFASISDHFHPWIEKQGHSPFVW